MYDAAAMIQKAEIAKDFGALEIFENWEREVPDGKHTDFRKAVKAEPGEKIVLAWIVWPDRETAAIAHKGMFADPRMAEVGELLATICQRRAASNQGNCERSGAMCSPLLATR